MPEIAVVLMLAMTVVMAVLPLTVAIMIVIVIVVGMDVFTALADAMIEPVDSHRAFLLHSVVG